MRRQTRCLLFLLLGLLLLQACSLKTAYRQLDWVLPEYAEDLVSLKAEQQGLLEQRTLAFLKWHRYTQLPAYVKTLEQLRRDARGQISTEQVLFHFERIQGHWQAMMQEFSVHIADLLLQLDQQQQAQLFASLAERNEDYREEHVKVSNDERHEQQLKSMRNRFERWLGDLNKAQLKLLQNAGRNMRPLGQARLDNRLSWQSRLRSVLAECAHKNSGCQQQKAAIVELFVHPGKIRDPLYQQSMSHNRQLWAQLVVDVAGLADKEQKQYFFETVDEYISDLSELAAER